MQDDRYQLFNRQFDSLEDFVDAISECLQCPVTLEDWNHHLLAYSSHNDQTDPVRISTIIGRRVPEKVINRFWKEGVIPALNQSDEPVIISEMTELGLGKRVAVSIRKNGEVLGYIWVSEVGDTLLQEDYELLKYAASKAKNQLLKLNLQKKKKERNYQEVLWQLISGDVNNLNHIQQDLDILGLHTSMSFAVMIIRFDQLSEEIYQKIIYVAKTSQKVSILIETLDENQIIFLLAPSKTSNQSELKSFSETLQAQIVERFQIKPSQIGCGYTYTNYQNMKQSYEEAQKVIQLKQIYPNETSDVFFYHELGVLRYVDLLQRTEALSTVGSHPALARLKTYDMQNRTNLLETLEMILMNDGNMNEAAKILHIHVNTLNYRMKRIKEVADIEFKDPIQKLGLYFDIILARGQKKSKHSPHS